MPDNPIATTIILGLGKWGDRDNPGFEALNENWDAVDAAAIDKGDTNPDSYPVDSLFLNTTDQVIFRNDGTEDVPIWTAILDVGTVAADVAAKADQSQVDTIASDLAVAQSDITTLQTNDYLKRDGSLAMTGDLDCDSNKIKALANGVASDEAVNRGQLDAAVSSALGALGSQIMARVTRVTDESLGASPSMVTWTAVDYDTGSMVNLGAHPTRITISVTGYYSIHSFVIIDDSGLGGATQIVKNGSAQLDVQVEQTPTVLGNGPWLRISTGPVLLTAGDYIELRTQATHGVGPHTTKGSVWPTHMSVFLETANAPGGGDFLADGSIPMTDDLDLGGNKAINAGDAVDPTDLTTLQQVEAADQDLQDQIDAITDGAALAGDQRRLTGGNQGFSTGGYELVTGSAMTFTLAVDKFVSIDANGTAVMDFEKRANLQLGIRLQKTGDSAIDIPGTYCFDPLGYYVNGSVVAAEKRTLVAGEWTISMIARKVDTSPPNNPILSKVAAAPAYIGYVLTG